MMSYCSTIFKPHDILSDAFQPEHVNQKHRCVDRMSINNLRTTTFYIYVNYLLTILVLCILF